MKIEPEIRDQIAEDLKVVPMFGSLGAEDRRAVLAAAQVIDIPAGEAITREGETVSDFFVLLSGQASVLMAADDNADPIEVAAVHAGETLGELGALLDEPRTATVIAERHCRLLRLDRA